MTLKELLCVIPDDEYIEIYFGQVSHEYHICRDWKRYNYIEKYLEKEVKKICANTTYKRNIPVISVCIEE